MQENRNRSVSRQLQNLLESLPIPLFLYDTEMDGVVYGNATCTEVTGGMPDEFALHPAVNPPFSTGAEMKFFSVHTANGASLSCSQMAELTTLLQQGSLPSAECRNLEVFQIHSRQKNGQKEQDWPTALIEHANSAIIKWQIDGTITFVNRYAEELFGYTQNELLGKNVSLLVPDKDSSGVDLGLLVENIANKPEQHVNSINENIRRDGRRLLISWTNTLLRNTDSGMPEILAIGNDTTKCKELETLSSTKEHLLRLFIAHAPVSLAMFDRSMRYLVTSRKWLTDYALGDRDLAGYLHYDIFPEISNHWKNIHQRGLAGEVIEAEADRFERSDGSVQWLHWKVLPWHDQYGEIGGIIIFSEDITQRKSIEEALRESEARYNAFINATKDLMFVKDAQSRYLTINTATESYFNRPREEILGKTDKDLMDEQSAYGCSLSDIQARNSGSIVVSEETAAGRTYETTKFPLALGSGQQGIGAIIRDITVHKQAVAAIVENELRYRTLADSGQALIWTAGLDKKCNYFNKIWLDFTGRPLSAELGDGWAEGVHPEDFHRCLETYVTSFDRRQPFSMEYRLRHHSGEYRWLQDDGTPRFDSEGNFIGFIGHCLDISERKHAEEEREKLQQKLNQAQKMESVGRLAGGVAHDFNNMLGIILGHADLALEQLDPANPIAADLREIHRAAERSADLTRQLLTFARKQIISPRILDLNEIVAGLLKMLRRVIGEDITLSWKPSPGLWKLRIDPSQIDQILANLCVNARDAIHGIGEIVVETENCQIDAEYCATHPEYIPGDYVALIVSDNGCGMSKETREMLFEPFFTTKELGKGTGLGLATIYGIVRQNKGFISVYSELESGSTFKIYLPRLLDSQEPAPSHDQIQPKNAARHHETILVVEDEPSILAMTTSMLERYGFTVLAVASPYKAIALAGQHLTPIHLLITDVIMPEMNGRNLARKIADLYPEMKTLYMSGYTANVIAQHGVLDSKVHFIQKPFSMNLLLTKVREALQTPASH